MFLVDSNGLVIDKTDMMLPLQRLPFITGIPGDEVVYGDIIKSSIELIVGLVDEPERALEARVFPCEVVERGTLKARSPSSAA